MKMDESRLPYVSKFGERDSARGGGQSPPPRKDMLLSMIPLPGSNLFETSSIKLQFLKYGKTPSDASLVSRPLIKEPELVVEDTYEAIEEQEEDVLEDEAGFGQGEQIDVKEFSEEEMRKEISSCQCECSKLLQTCFQKKFSASHIRMETTVKPKKSSVGFKPNDGIVPEEQPLTQAESENKDAYEGDEEAVHGTEGQQRLWFSSANQPCLVKRPYHDAYNRMKKLLLRRRSSETSTAPTEEEKEEDRRRRLQEAIDETKEEVVSALHKKIEKIFFIAKQQMNEEYLVRAEKYEKEFAVTVEDALNIAKEKTREKTETRFNKQLEALRHSMTAEFESYAQQEGRRIRDSCDFVTQATMRENEELFDFKYRHFVDASMKWLHEVKRKMEDDKLHENHAKDLAFLRYVSKFMEAKFEAFLALRKEYNDIEDRYTAELTANDKEIINMKKKIAILSRDIAIRKGLIKEILSQYKQFTAYALQKWPSKLEFPLSLRRLYQMHMDELFREEDNKVVEFPQPQETLSEAGRTRLSGFPSQSDISTRGSSSCSEIEPEIRSRKIATHVIDQAICNAIPSPREDSEEKKSEKLGATKWEWLTMKSTSRPLFTVGSIEGTGKDPMASEEGKGLGDSKMFVGEESNICQPVHDFTKKRIRDFRGLLLEKGDILKPFVTNIRK